MSKGTNLAESVNVKKSYASSNLKNPDVCFFISHYNIDKPTAKAIGKYITNAELNIYLDVNDQQLQDAVAKGDVEAITASIEKGINLSTHIICLISKDTKKSWWVPYEIGYGKKAGKEVVTLMLKDVINIPEFLKITNVIKGTKSFNRYLEQHVKIFKLFYRTSKSIYENNLLEKHSETNHPLDQILKWEE